MHDRVHLITRGQQKLNQNNIVLKSADFVVYGLELLTFVSHRGRRE